MKIIKRLPIIAVICVQLTAFMAVAGCTKSDDDSTVNCNKDSEDVDNAETAFYQNKTTTNCKDVVAAYQYYIKDNCSDAESYKNSLDAFQKANNNCQ